VDGEADQEEGRAGGEKDQALAEWVRRQRVHTRALTTLPPISTLPICRFGRKRRLVRTLEWLTLCPYCGVLPQMLHFCAMVERSAGEERTGIVP
jgi:hypothetical protein